MSAPDPHAPSLLRNKGCWLTFLTGIPLLIGLAWFIEDQAGHRFLAKTKARLAAEGQLLDREKVLPGLPVRPPDAENFCAIPLLVEIGKGDPTSPEFAAVKQIAEWESYFRYGGEGGNHYTSQEFPDPTDWNEVWRFIVKNDRKAGLPAMPDDAARELSAVIEARAGKPISELEAALDRPYAVMLPTVREDLPRWEAGQVIWFTSLQECGRCLALRVRLALASDDPQRAARMLRVMLRMADAAERHGSLVAALVGLSIRSLASSIAWVGLRDRVFDAKNLGALAESMRGFDGQAKMMLAFQREAIVSAGMRKQVRVTPESVFETAGFTPHPWHHWAMQLVPGGWFDYGEGMLLAQQASWHAYLGDEGNPHRFARDSWPGWKACTARLPSHNWMATYILQAYRNVPSSFATNSAVMHLAGAACALEVYFIDHQTYPASLEMLVPQYLPAVPMDLDQKPIRYAQDTANSRYELWSVGVNGTDEGGVEKAEISGRLPKPWREPVGDWVWRYP